MPFCPMAFYHTPIKASCHLQSTHICAHYIQMSVKTSTVRLLNLCPLFEDSFELTQVHLCVLAINIVLTSKMVRSSALMGKTTLSIQKQLWYYALSGIF